MRPKKHLGQHFLRSTAALGAIISAAQLEKTDTVVEIGPGKGVLTEYLLKQARRVIAIEKDPLLVEHLQKRFSEACKHNRLVLIEGDVLSLPIESYLSEVASYKLVANIPYYITGAIIEQFLTASVQPERIVLLLQKEVAERIVAKDGKESILSISVKAYGTPRHVQTVPARAFTPPPKVDSAILLIENISRDFFKKNAMQEKHFFSLVKQGFAHKRKKLAVNIGLDKQTITQCGLTETVRAEELSITDWLCVSRLVHRATNKR